MSAQPAVGCRLWNRFPRLVPAGADATCRPPCRPCWISKAGPAKRPRAGPVLGRIDHRRAKPKRPWHESASRCCLERSSPAIPCGEPSPGRLGPLAGAATGGSADADDPAGRTEDGGGSECDHEPLPVRRGSRGTDRLVASSLGHWEPPALGSGHGLGRGTPPHSQAASGAADCRVSGRGTACFGWKGWKTSPRRCAPAPAGRTCFYPGPAERKKKWLALFCSAVGFSPAGRPITMPNEWFGA